jgi:hypothetical protein
MKVTSAPVGMLWGCSPWRKARCIAPAAPEQAGSETPAGNQVTKSRLNQVATAILPPRRLILPLLSSLTYLRTKTQNNSGLPYVCQHSGAG